MLEENKWAVSVSIANRIAVKYAPPPVSAKVDNTISHGQRRQNPTNFSSIKHFLKRGGAVLAGGFLQSQPLRKILIQSLPRASKGLRRFTQYKVTTRKGAFV
jgi:hypothetical protein